MRTFQELGRIEDPSVDALILFVDDLGSLFDTLLHDESFMHRLTRHDAKLAALAHKSYAADVRPALQEMRLILVKTQDRLVHFQNTSDTPGYDRLVTHGLFGVSAQFKYSVLAKVMRSWRRHKGQLTVGAGFARVTSAIDAILDSLIEALGAGGVVKEFKDALAALVPTRSGE
jgi:hypothetical protein